MSASADSGSGPARRVGVNDELRGAGAGTGKMASSFSWVAFMMMMVEEEAQETVDVGRGSSFPLYTAPIEEELPGSSRLQTRRVRRTQT